MFSQDPTSFMLCLIALTGEKEDPIKPLKDLVEEFHPAKPKGGGRRMFWSRLARRLFPKAMRKQGTGAVAKPVKKGHRCAALNRVNFELLEVYAATDQANSSRIKGNAGYPHWRRRRYPLGLAHEAVEQMVLPLAVASGKKSATALFEAELKLRTSMQALVSRSGQ